MNLDDSVYDSDELDQNHLSSVSLQYHKDRSKPSRTRVFTLIFLIVNLCIFCFNTSIFGITWSKIRTTKKYCPVLPYSPANPALRYEERIVDRWAPNPYLGNMSSIVAESVWRATRKELEDTGALYDDDLRFENGGYLAITGVNHEIHCLDWIKNGWLHHKDERPQLEEHLEHTNHCLSTLRKRAMCHADLSIGSWYWRLSDDGKLARRSDATRQCLVWDSFQTFMEARRIDTVNGVPTEATLDAEGNVLSRYGD